MAIILPLLLLLVMGTIEFGRVFGSYLVMENLSRSAARFGVVGHTDQEIRDLIAGQNPFLSTDRLVINISPGETLRNRGDPLTVSLEYTLDLVTPVMSDILPNPFPLSASCTMMVE
jgi:hypothetical protein